MNLYFEIPLSHETGEFRYITISTLAKEWQRTHARTRLSQSANRIWAEVNGKVHYVKNRYRNTADPVDMKEFMFIKLRSLKT